METAQKAMGVELKNLVEEVGRLEGKVENLLVEVAGPCWDAIGITDDGEPNRLRDEVCSRFDRAMNHLVLALDALEEVPALVSGDWDRWQGEGR